MSSYDFSQHEFTPEGSAFIDARLFDQLEDIQSLCNVFSLRPNEINAKRLEEASSEHMKSALIAFQQFNEESTEGNHIENLVAYAKGLEMQRIAFLNNIHPSEESTYVVADEQYEALLDHLLCEECDCEEEPTPADHVFDLYQSSFQVDLNQLSTISTDAYEKTPEARRKEFMRKFGKHALGVAKVGLGVFIGIAAAKKSKFI